VLKELLHPAGLIAYAEVKRTDEFTTPRVRVASEINQEAA
jgi:hypothetical protein